MPQLLWLDHTTGIFQSWSGGLSQIVEWIKARLTYLLWQIHGKVVADIGSVDGQAAINE
jgi:hypothetical protein